MRTCCLPIQNHLIASHLTQHEIQNAKTVSASSLGHVTCSPVPLTTSLSLIPATFIFMLSSNIADNTNTGFFSLQVLSSLDPPPGDIHMLIHLTPSGFCQHFFFYGGPLSRNSNFLLHLSL